MNKYIVELTTQERAQLKDIIDAERMAAHKRRHARMLLKADQGEATVPARYADNEPQAGKPRNRCMPKPEHVLSLVYSTQERFR